MSALIAILLVLEGFSTGMATVGRLPTIAIYPTLTVAVIAVRGLLGVLQFASGWMLLQRRVPASVLARWSLTASAVLLTLELGFGLAPTNLFPTYQWPAVAAYWIYAVVAIWILKPGVRDDRGRPVS